MSDNISNSLDSQTQPSSAASTDTPDRTMSDHVRRILEQAYILATADASKEKSEIDPAELAGAIGEVLYGRDDH